MGVPEKILCIVVTIIAVVFIYKYMKEKQRNSMIEVLRESNKKGTVLVMFIDFLTRNEIYTEFMSNFNCSKSARKRFTKESCSLESYCNSVKKDDFIKSAFDWSSSEEQQEFWNEMDLRWKRYIADHNTVDVEEVTQRIIEG